jgi:pyruvate dehydrogenase E2 component (dihydrolipoamide acetyltransferase)
MAEKIIMPKQGLQMTEGTIIEWKKQVGDTVKEGETLFEIETDKLNIDIDAPASGTLLAVLRKEGETVPITEIIGYIGEAGEDVSSLTGAPKEPPTEAPTGASGRKFVTPRARKTAEEKQLDLQQITGTGPEGLVIERDVLAAAVSAGSSAPGQPAATPTARKLAERTGQDLASITGTGPRGKIYSADIAAASQQKSTGGYQESAEYGVEEIPMRGMRKVIAERMRSSLDEAAQAVHRMDIDMSEAVRLRAAFKAEGRAVSFNDIMVRAAAAALKRHPRINRQIGSNGNILQFRDVNIGIAVALDEGLIVPVISHADQRSLEDIHAESLRLAAAARSNTLQPEDLAGGRFTISNLGMYGLDSFTAIINRPESCILAVGSITDRPVVIEKQLAVRPVCTVSLTYDHRLIDGAPAAEFLQTLRGIMQNPLLMI